MEINSRCYTDFLKIANTPEKAPGYLCRKRKTLDYAVFFTPKKGPFPLPNYERLSFREIVRLGIQFKKELMARPSDAALVSKELLRMSNHREASESKRNFVIRLAHRICDCVRNLFGGLGWKTTAKLARELSHALAASLPKLPYAPLPAAAEAPTAAPKAPAEPVPASIQAAPAAPLLPSKAMASYAIQPTAHSKKVALETYRQNPASCTQQDKMTIWLEIGKFEPTLREIVNKQIVSVKMLMAHMSASTKADVTDPGCGHVIVDSFRLCNKATTSELALWLTKEKRFSAALLGQCLAALSRRAKEKTSTDSYALHLLLNHYATNKWNQTLPCTNPQVVEAVEALLLEDHNAPNAIAMTKWMTDQKEFNADAFATLTRVFVRKAAANPGTTRNTRFDALNHLLDWYSRNPISEQELLVKNRDVAFYLTA